MPVNDKKVGKLRVLIGTVNGNQLRFLGLVHQCKKDLCPVKDLCPFEPKGNCTMEQTFVSSLYRDWVDPEHGIGDKLNQVTLDRIGTHLMPMYLQLIRFQVETLTLNQTTYVDKAGRHNPFPQFREIREVLHAIRREMKDLNLEGIWEEKFGKKKPVPVGQTPEEMLKNGASGAYERLAKEIEAEQKDRQG